MAELSNALGMAFEQIELEGVTHVRELARTDVSLTFVVVKVN